METKDLRQRSFASQRQKYSYQNDESLPDDKARSPRSSHWCTAVISVLLAPVLFLVIYLNLLADENSLPVAFSLPDPPRLEGALNPNNHLHIAERLYEGQVLGPESIVFDHGHLYTGTSDGKVLHIYKGELTTLAALGKPPCGGYENEPTCGRPLGMRLDADGYLIVLDTYLGMYKINVATGDTHLLLPSTVEIDGRPLRFMNDLDIDSDGNIYFTDSSGYQRRDFFLDVLDGRAAGRYHLKGIKAGHAEVFVENLPCLPDNIRRSSTGGYWIACGFTRYDGKFNLLDFTAQRPWIRWIISKVPVEWVLPPPTAMLLELNGRGDIVRALMDMTGEKVRYPSEVEDDAGTLYIGSFREPYIVRVRLDQLRSVTD